jgi:predicted MFS family arabinose efflux permease
MNISVPMMLSRSISYFTAVYAAMSMDLSDPRISASMFVLFMMFVNLGTVGGQMLAGILTERTGFSSMVLVLGAVNLIIIFLVFALFRRRAGKPAY